MRYKYPYDEKRKYHAFFYACVFFLSGFGMCILSIIDIFQLIYAHDMHFMTRVIPFLFVAFMISKAMIHVETGIPFNKD